VFSDWRALGCVYTSGREVVEREREREDEREAGMMLGGGEARVRLPMVALQSAMAVDRDAQRDGNAARRQEAARLYENAIEALEEALQRKPSLSLSRARAPATFWLLLTHCAVE
jgi:hypothetical protein